MRFFDYLLVAAIAASFYCQPANPDVGERLLQDAGPSIVKLTPPQNRETGGTGFLLKERAGFVIVSNGHVCGIATDGQMTAWNDDGSSFPVKVRKISDTTDLCLLDPVRPELTKLKSQPLQLAEYQHRAERLWVVGHPHLEDNTVASGYVVSFQDIKLMDGADEAHCTGPSRSWVELFCIRTIYAFNTSIVIYPGNSGSPVMTRDGYVVGVMFAASSETHFGAFIPFSDLKEFVQSP